MASATVMHSSRMPIDHPTAGTREVRAVDGAPVRDKTRGGSWSTSHTHPPPLFTLYLTRRRRRKAALLRALNRRIVKVAAAMAVAAAAAHAGGVSSAAATLDASCKRCGGGKRGEVGGRGWE